MATEVLMPKLGATMESGTILRWYKQEGEPIHAGESLLEIMTDKVNMEIEAPTDGTVLKILYGQDELVAVQQPIAYIGQPGEEVSGASATEASVTGAGATEAPAPQSKAASAASDRAATAVLAEAHSQEAAADGKLRATPAARKLARKEGVPLAQVKGTGPFGRIQLSDVQQQLAERAKAPRVTPLAQKIAEAQGISLDTVTGTGVQGKIGKEDVLRAKPAELPAAAASAGERVKLDGMRKVIAQRMTHSATTAPHVTLTTEVDMSRSIELRQALLPVIEQRTGLRLSYTEILMKAVSHALVLHPRVNASIQDDYIVFHPTANIGLAVAVANGLVVPVIPQTERKGLAELTVACKQQAQRAREGKLLPADMTGGTFTISNLGMYAIDAFTPIINQPESAILGVGRINEKPVGIQGKIELRPMMTLSLSFDHRAIDGAPAAEFLQTIKETLENPYQLML